MKNSTNSAKKPKLSIGMIVKNEAKNLRQCLTALQPILAQVESELIIADTGSTDETVSIAREFTPNVMEIEWKDDFSEARNHTVRASNGEWFMFMDADEFWKDTDELVAFFNSGEYKKYRSASYLRQNILPAGKTISDTRNGLVQKDKNTAFIGIIHESIPIKPPQKFLRSYAIHTGYNHATPEQERKKKERNLSLLIRAYKNNPTSLHVISQLCHETVGDKDQTEHKKYIDLGFNMVKNNPKIEQFHFFYHRIALFYFWNNNFEEAIKYVQLYLEKCGKLTVAAIDMYQILAESHQKLNDIDKAIQAYETCLDLCRKLSEDKLDTEPASYDLLLCMEPSFASKINTSLLLLYNSKQDYENVLRLSRDTDPTIKAFLPMYLATIVKAGQFGEAIYAYRQIAKLKDTESGQESYNQLLAVFDGTAKAHPAQIGAAFADYKDGDTYVRLLQLRHADIQGKDIEKELLEFSSFLTNLTSSTNSSNQEVPFAQAEYLFLLMKHDLSFLEEAAQIDIDDMAETIAWMVDKRKDFYQVLARYVNNVNFEEAQSTQWIYNLCITALNAEGLSSAEEGALYRGFTRAAEQHMWELYLPAVLTDEGIEQVAGHYRFAYYSRKADKALEAGDAVGFLRAMKTAMLQSDRFAKAGRAHVERCKTVLGV